MKFSVALTDITQSLSFDFEQGFDGLTVVNVIAVGVNVDVVSVDVSKVVVLSTDIYFSGAVVSVVNVVESVVSVVVVSNVSSVVVLSPAHGVDVVVSSVVILLFGVFA